MRAGLGHEALLPRVRDLFLLLVVLVQVVQVVEWLDADTALWPQRTMAAVALLGAVVVALALHRRRRPHLLLDVGLLAAVVGAGWGLGRPGAVIALLVGVSQLRALYGDRRSVTMVMVGLVVAYGLVTFLTQGVDGVVDLGVVAVGLGVAALALVIRLVGEAMASHDLGARWDATLTEATEELVGATSLEEIDEGVVWALGQLEHGATTAGGGLWATPVPAGAVPRTATQLSQAVTRSRVAEAAPRLGQVLRRLEGNRILARDRVLSEQRFRLLAEESQDVIYVLGLGATPTWHYLNPAAQALLGVSADEARQDPEAVIARIHPDDRALLLRARGQRRGDQGVLDEPVRFRVTRGSDDQVTWLEAREVVLERQGSRVHLVQGVARDVTRQWNEELALRRALQQQEAAAADLRELDEMKSMFLRAVSHELRTPLTAVLGAAVTLRRREELDTGDVEALLDAIHRQASHLERLLEDLLDVDRLSRGIITPDREPTELLDLVHRVIGAMDTGTEPITVEGTEVVAALDAAKVERIVDNLLRNAVKHTPPGTAVRVVVSGDGTGAVLSVEDEGPGIPGELRERIFEPFAQGATGTAEVASPGTGIGLALVSKLAELHGGHAWVEEPDGGGARFVVTLPGADPDGIPPARDGRQVPQLAPD